ncbi:uncharacterized protein (DUF697 family) [Oxalobacteraceae bacterium GrIS 2.11]
MAITAHQKIHGIIHTCAAACAGIGAGLAQIPGSDSAAIVPLQTAMIVSIAAEHGASVSHGLAADLLLTFTATMAGRTVSQFLLGWIPVAGNIINASTAAAITEAIGWAANSYFEKN